jgi:hypothetical protein
MYSYHDDQHTQHRFGFLPAGPLTARPRLCGQEIEMVLAHHVLAGDVFVIERATPGSLA